MGSGEASRGSDFFPFSDSGGLGVGVSFLQGLPGSLDLVLSGFAFPVCPSLAHLARANLPVHSSTYVAPGPGSLGDLGP